MKCHYDTRGHRILGYIDMIEYYKGDQHSLNVIRSTPLTKVIVWPSIQIYLEYGNTTSIVLTQFWPAEVVSKTQFINERALSTLRRLFIAPWASWVVTKHKNGVTWKLAGRVEKDKIDQFPI